LGREIPRPSRAAGVALPTLPPSTCLVPFACQLSLCMLSETAFVAARCPKWGSLTARGDSGDSGDRRQNPSLSAASPVPGGLSPLPLSPLELFPALRRGRMRGHPSGDRHSLVNPGSLAPVPGVPAVPTLFRCSPRRAPSRASSARPGGMEDSGSDRPTPPSVMGSNRAHHHRPPRPRRDRPPHRRRLGQPGGRRHTP
jgi:hypothetical protein